MRGEVWGKGVTFRAYLEKQNSIMNTTRNWITVSGLVLTIISIYACKTSKGITLENKALEQQYNTSLETWNKLKKKHDNSYTFTVIYSSWVGYRATTKIKVKKGKIVSRMFSENKQKEDGRGFTGEEALVYEENETNINSNERGFTGVTIDRLYSDCAEYSLVVDEEVNTITLNTNEEGVITQCGFRDKMCMDDCFQGYTLGEIVWE